MHVIFYSVAAQKIISGIRRAAYNDVLFLYLAEANNVNYNACEQDDGNDDEHRRKNRHTRRRRRTAARNVDRIAKGRGIAYGVGHGVNNFVHAAHIQLDIHMSVYLAEEK